MEAKIKEYTLNGLLALGFFGMMLHPVMAIVFAIAVFIANRYYSEQA